MWESARSVSPCASPFCKHPHYTCDQSLFWTRSTLNHPLDHFIITVPHRRRTVGCRRRQSKASVLWKELDPWATSDRTGKLARFAEGLATRIASLRGEASQPHRHAERPRRGGAFREQTYHLCHAFHFRPWGPSYTTLYRIARKPRAAARDADPGVSMRLVELFSPRNRPSSVLWIFTRNLFA